MNQDLRKLKSKPLYEFGPFRLDVAERLLLRNRAAIPLQPKAFDLLLVLVQNRGHLVEKDELLRTVWPDTIVEEVNLANNVSILRKILGGGADGEPVIETVPRRGYRFLADVKIVADERSAKEETKELGTPAGVEKDESGKQRAEVAAATTSVRPRYSTEDYNRGRRRALLILIGLATVLGAFGIYRFTRRNDSTPRAPVHPMTLTRLTSDPGLTTDPALSPDGTLLACASDRSGEGNLDIWVQQVAKGEALRLTHHEADEREPAFSPDGGMIAFRSERDGGRIYVVSALGGEPRLIAKQGRRPRFSPDGKEIAYWVGTPGSDIWAPGDTKTYIVASSGGAPRQLQPHFAAACFPVWSPDGKHILFLGNREPAPVMEDILDWWVGPVDGGEAVRTGMLQAFHQQGLFNREVPSGTAPGSPSHSIVAGIWESEGSQVVFSAKLGDSTNLWRVPVSPETGRILGSAQRLTFGAGLEVQPSLGAGRRLVFSNLISNVDIWSLPVAASQARVLGGVQRLTANTALERHPDISADGRKLVFASNRSGNFDIWLKDLEDGKELALTVTASEEAWPAISADGLKVAYGALEHQKIAIYVVDSRGGVPERVCDDCGRFDDWSADGKRMLYHLGQPRRVALLEVDSGTKRDLLVHSKYNLYQPHFSLDGLWVTFLAQMGPERRRLYIAPLQGRMTSEESEWRAITSGEFSDDKPRFSPDGNLLYFTSNRDGFVCLWAQRLDPAKKPIGPAFAIYHFHSARLSMLNLALATLELSVAHDKIVFNLGELTGNIWLTELAEEQ
jgi:eukaryotic-like serine/threonine-protein kinase